MFNKRGVVSIGIYSLLVLLMIGILSFSFWFYDDSSSNFQDLSSLRDLQSSVYSLRNVILDLSLVENSTIEYRDVYAEQGFYFNCSDNKIQGFYSGNDDVLAVNATLFGFEFCESYVVSPLILNRIYFNGSCFSFVG